MNNNMRKFRLKKEFTQGQVANKLDIAVSTYNMMENGKRKVSLAKAKKLEKILDASIDELFFKNNIHNEQNKTS